MNANELRRGNLVDTVNRCGTVHLPANTPMRVYDIAPFGVSLYYPENNPATMAHIPTYDIKDICGIPITEEVLLKCGFISDDFENDPPDWLCWKVGTKSTLQTDRSCNFSFIEFTTSLGRIKISHLHELQNLIYMLTGQELTYTP